MDGKGWHYCNAVMFRPRNSIHWSLLWDADVLQLWWEQIGKRSKLKRLGHQNLHTWEGDGKGWWGYTQDLGFNAPAVRALKSNLWDPHNFDSWSNSNCETPQTNIHGPGRYIHTYSCTLFTQKYVPLFIVLVISTARTWPNINGKNWRPLPTLFGTDGKSNTCLPSKQQISLREALCSLKTFKPKGMQPCGMLSQDCDTNVSVT